MRTTIQSRARLLHGCHVCQLWFMRQPIHDLLLWFIHHLRYRSDFIINDLWLDLIGFISLYVPILPGCIPAFVLCIRPSGHCKALNEKRAHSTSIGWLWNRPVPLSFLCLYLLIYAYGIVKITNFTPQIFYTR